MVQPKLKVLLVILVAAIVVASLVLAWVYPWNDDGPSSIEETVWIQGDAELASSKYVTSGDSGLGIAPS